MRPYSHRQAERRSSERSAHAHTGNARPEHPTPAQRLEHTCPIPERDAPSDDPRSCCALAEVVTEFGCQGLELDMPVVCWGSDFSWTGADWELKPKRRRDHVDDPEQLLLNAYRVLLTRGRDGFIVYLPPVAILDTTEHALLAAGVLPLPDAAHAFVGQAANTA